MILRVRSSITASADARDVSLQAIVQSESKGGVFAGVNTMLIPQTTARICLLQALSSVGRCKTFDSSADGYGMTVPAWF